MKRLTELLFTLSLLFLCSDAMKVQAWQNNSSDLSLFYAEKTHFALARQSDGQILYGKDAQNMAVADYNAASASCVTLFYELEKSGDNYMLRTITPSGGTYSLWGNPVCYLNAQSIAGGVAFNLGLNNQKGEDLENGAVWKITFDKSHDAFTLQNVGLGEYLNGASTKAEAEYWNLIPESKYGGYFTFTGYDDADYTLLPLHQQGKDLVNSKGRKVTLHGVMDTPNAYFNNNRWQISDWNSRYNNDEDVRRCLVYFNTLLSAFVNHEQGSYCDLFRLHLDPAWTNDPAKTATNGGQENDISRFSEARLSTYLDKLYWPIIEMAKAKGLYVIVRPPGVCPQNIQVGDEYQQYLLKVWDIVSKNENVQKFAGQVMLELANEPITVKDASGNASDHALYDFFQPIVDKIRSNGYKGVLWVPGSGYQSNYQGYATYPIKGDNIGYAVHFYPGWMGTDYSFDNNVIISRFKQQVPVVESRPIAITEVDWSPEKSPKEVDHVNEMGQTVYKNYGTWATGRSSEFGKVFKAVHDYYGNISMTLTHPYEYLDFDALFNDGIVKPAFGNMAEPEEACAKFCFDWYKTLAQDHSVEERPHTLTFKDGYYEEPALISSSSVEAGNPITAPAVPTHEGYEFMGWSPAVPATMPASDVVYTARFVKIPHVVRTYTDLSSIGSGVFAIVNTSDGTALYGSDMQNMAMGSYAMVTGGQTATSYYKLDYVPEKDSYRLITIQSDMESTYSCYGVKTCYLNAQTSTTGVVFNLGLNNQDGQDLENGALWKIEYVEGRGFTLKNVGNGAYLAGTNTSATPVYWSFCTLWDDVIADGSYYVYNVKSGMMLSNGAFWGTRAVLSDQGIAYDVHYDATLKKYELRSYIKGSTSALRPSDAFNDQSGYWEALSVPGMEGAYYLYNGTQYFGYIDGSIPDFTDTPNDGSIWMFVTSQSRKDLLQGATPASPVDATVYIVAPDFLNGDCANDAWNGVTVGGNNGQYNTIVDNTNAERWNVGTFDVKQSITGLPNGVYQLSFNAFYRHGGLDVANKAYENGTEVLPVIYANDKEIPVRSVYAEAKRSATAGWSTASGTYYIPNSQSDAAACFDAGGYQHTLTSIVVTDNTLALGVKRTAEACQDWTVFDKFRLTYYGPSSSFKRGDVNADGKYSIADMVTLVNILLGKSEITPQSDADNNGIVDIKDVDALRQLLMK